jgi:hypothetical protein
MASVCALPDFTAKAVVVGVAVFLILFLGVLPPALRRIAGNDLRGVPMQTADGQVILLNISPTTQGGSSLYNAVSVAFAGKTGFYALPRSSRWAPIIHESVRVKYRVGRRTGQVHVEDVEPVEADSATPKK